MEYDVLQKNRQSIKSILKAGMVIDLLAAADAPLSISVIAKELSMAKSTLHGIVSTLVDIGYLQQVSESGKYQLGIRLFEIGSSISKKWNEQKIAYPYIQKLVEQTGETVHMAIFSNGEVLYTNKHESGSSIRIVTETGTKLPAHCTGVGKALLSGLSRHDLKQTVEKKGLKQYTPNTITTFSRLKEEMNTIREVGYAVDNEEFVEGLKCVAAPVFNHIGKVTATLSISGPVSRMRDKDFEQKKNYLMQAVKEISLQLGYQSYPY